MKKRIVFITPTSSQPRHHKRIIDFIHSGYDVTVYSFRRGYYENNALPAAAEVVYIGNIGQGSYQKRLFVYVMACMKVFINEMGERRAGLFYGFGHDNVWIAWIVKPMRSLLVYEVGDIQYLNVRNEMAKKALSFLENFILKRTNLLVVTSPGFLDEHYATICPQISEKTLIVENKLSKNVFTVAMERPVPRAPQSVIKIGFVGAFKYEDKFVAILEAVAKRQDRYQFHIFGDGPFKSTIETYCRQYKNIFYHGPYKSPSELNTIYNLVDVSFCIYDNSDRNVKLAIPNKYYESIFFGVPMIVSANTALAARIKQINGGFIIDTEQSDSMDIFLDQLTAGDVRTASINMLKETTTTLIDNYDVVFTINNSLKICNLI